jgi:hypothetical protein
MKRAVVALLALLAAGCDEGVAGPSTAPQLRVVNAGPASLEQLSALFPEEQVSFGDVHPGTPTTYRAVPKGVYRYAAWRFVRDGSPVLQPVIDWVGESPMDGEAFTYTIAMRTGEDGVARLVLTNVTRDR